MLRLFLTSPHCIYVNIYVANVAGLSVLTLSGRGQVAVGAPGPGGAPRPVSLHLLTSLVIS